MRVLVCNDSIDEFSGLKSNKFNGFQLHWQKIGIQIASLLLSQYLQTWEVSKNAWLGGVLD